MPVTWTSANTDLLFSAVLSLHPGNNDEYEKISNILVSKGLGCSPRAAREQMSKLRKLVKGDSAAAATVASPAKATATVAFTAKATANLASPAKAHNKGVASTKYEVDWPMSAAPSSPTPTRKRANTVVDHEYDPATNDGTPTKKHKASNLSEQKVDLSDQSLADLNSLVAQLNEQTKGQPPAPKVPHMDSKAMSEWVERHFPGAGA